MTGGLLENFALDDWLIDQDHIFLTFYDKRDDTDYINSFSKINLKTGVSEWTKNFKF